MLDSVAISKQNQGLMEFLGGDLRPFSDKFRLQLLEKHGTATLAIFRNPNGKWFASSDIELFPTEVWHTFVLHALRQPHVSPTHAPSGMPATDATDQPRNTNVMALPRLSGDTIRPILAAAWGVKMAGASMASTRSGSNAS